MAKGKKKKKDLDFQKVKLKVGRKLKRDSNETKAEFKTRKIILKEVKSYSHDPLTALSRHGDRMSQHGKLSMLNHFNSALTQEVVRSLTKPILDSLSKFLVDHSDSVRAAAIKCLKTCYNLTRQQQLSTKDFMLSLKPYLDCAFTHVSTPIVTDCFKFLEYFVNINDPQTFEPLMEIVLRRFHAGNLSTAEKVLAVKLRRYYIRYKDKESVESQLKGDQIEPHKWTETNYILDLDEKLHDFRGLRLDEGREFQLGFVPKIENVAGKFLETIRDEDSTREGKTSKQPAKKRRIF